MYRSVLALLLLLAFLVADLQASSCPMQNWPSPSVVNGWRHGGASEKCFCAYGNDLNHQNELNAACPGWKKYISTDNAVADKVTISESATTLGKERGNSTARKYGYMTVSPARLHLLGHCFQLSPTPRFRIGLSISALGTAATATRPSPLRASPRVFTFYRPRGSST